MATTFIDTIQVTNISNQIVNLQIAKLANSAIFTGSGLIQLAPKATVEAEDNRFDISQLTNIRRNKLIDFIRFSRQATTSSGTDSSDASA